MVPSRPPQSFGISPRQSQGHRESAVVPNNATVLPLHLGHYSPLATSASTADQAIIRGELTVCQALHKILITVHFKLHPDPAK